MRQSEEIWSDPDTADLHNIKLNYVNEVQRKKLKLNKESDVQVTQNKGITFF